MSLLETLAADLVAARKAQDKPLTLLLGTIIADVRNREIELKRVPGNEEVVEVVRRGIKKRRESVEMYEQGGRDDLARKEREEVAMLERYLPAASSDEELRGAVRAAIAGGARNVGAVMGLVMKDFKGRVDGAAINAIAREELAKQA